MPNATDLRRAFLQHVCQTSDAPLGLEIAHARGATLHTTDGRRYIDLMAGIGVNNVGHAHPAVVAAIQEQADRYLHAMVYGEYVLEPQVRLAARLAELLPDPLSVIYFTNSGTEANEGALKLAKKATGRRRLVAFEGSYHGDTHGSLSITGREVYRRPFLPLLPEVDFLPWDDLAALARIDNTVAAVITEPIQGEGGVRVPVPRFLPELRRRCDETGALLIFDEVQTGFGRTGALFALEHWGVVPDVLVMAKALGGGMPLGGFAGRPALMVQLRRDPPLSHVTTFGGHPVCCAAGLAALEVLLAEDLPARAARLGEEMRSSLGALGVRYGGIHEVRGMGLLIGIEFESAELTERFARAALDRGVILGWTLHSNRVIRLAPPLNITTAELATAAAALEEALRAAVSA
ncbi:MAG: aspartate aminotransferase family protein [Armatimonadetes bacterium]|nr:aspartate aminotransferase family protein [Armatimonadota bacterium]